MARRRVTGVSANTANSIQTKNPPANGGVEGQLIATAGAGDISLVIPADATLEAIEGTLAIAINGYQRLTDAAERLKPIIGRLLLTVRERKLWKPSYRNFTDYVMRKIVAEYHFGRSNAFYALDIAEAYPTMDSSSYARYGASRLQVAAQHGIDERTTGYQGILDKSLGVTVEAFRAALEEATPGNPPIVEPAATTTTLTIRCSVGLQQRWSAILRESGRTAAELLQSALDSLEALATATRKIEPPLLAKGAGGIVTH